MRELIKSKIDKFIAIGAAFGIAVSLTGCQLKPRHDRAVAANPASIGGEVETDTSTTVAAKQPSKIVIEPPIVLSIANDKSRSVTSSKIPNLTIDSLMPLLQAVAKNGGELRLGDVCTDSDLPLAAFYSTEPPSPIDTPLPQKPTLQMAGNPLNLPKLNQEYRQQLALYQQRETAHHKEVAERDRTNERKKGIFIAQVKKLLDRSANCGATDIIGMMKRLDLYHNEPVNWKQKPRKVAILITDGLETVKANPKPIEWTSKAEVVLVSSGGEAGILQPLLTNTPFESIDAAVRYVVVGRKPN